MEENNNENVEILEEVENTSEGIQIASDVIAVIAGVAVSEVNGVFAMAGGFAGGITEVLKGKKNLAKGIKVETENNKAKIDVNIIVEYGARIPDVAFEIQNKVKKSKRQKKKMRKIQKNNKYSWKEEIGFIKLIKYKMKKLDKIILALFSVLMFLASILIICVIVGWIELNTVNTFANMALANDTTSKVILGLAIVCLLCSIKGIFFESSDKKNKKQGVLMQNDNGKLLISKSTIENIVQNVVKEFDSVENTSVSTDFDNLNNLIINVNLVVGKSVVIKELTINMQNKIKEAIKKTSDLDVKEVNVKIKDIAVDKKKDEIKE